MIEISKLELTGKIPRLCPTTSSFRYAQDGTRTYDVSPSSLESNMFLALMKIKDLKWKIQEAVAAYGFTTTKPSWAENSDEFNLKTEQLVNEKYTFLTEEGEEKVFLIDTFYGDLVGLINPTSVTFVTGGARIPEIGFILDVSKNYFTTKPPLMKKGDSYYLLRDKRLGRISICNSTELPAILALQEWVEDNFIDSNGTYLGESFVCDLFQSMKQIELPEVYMRAYLGDFLRGFDFRNKTPKCKTNMLNKIIAEEG